MLKQSRILFAVLAFLTTLILVWPFTNYQDPISQGDHGRDLYAAEASLLRGELPYRDYWWIYGPIMPYYYGIFFKLFGVSIHSMLLGHVFLRLAAGMLIYAAAVRFITPAAAYLAAIWFVHFYEGFIHTYNHIGAIPGFIGIILCLFLYLQDVRRQRILFIALLLSFLCGLVKVNFGITTLLGILLSVAGIDFFNRNKPDRTKIIFYVLGGLGVPALLFAVYASFLAGLDPEIIKQSLPYTREYRMYDAPILGSLFNLLNLSFEKFTSRWWHITMIVVACGSALLLLRNLRWRQTENRPFILALGILALFYGLNIHEFLKSSVGYCISWSQPFAILGIFLILGRAFPLVPKWLRLGILIAVTAAVIGSFQNVYTKIEGYRKPEHFLALERGQVYLTNPQDWMMTVTQTTELLKKINAEGSAFAAFPYDPLYYFLTGQPTPNRQFALFEFNHVSPNLEAKLIEELQANRVRYILLSSRMISEEQGLGIFGETYCPMTALYVRQNFQMVVRLGNWKYPAGWAKNHGVMIFKAVKF